MNSVNLSQDLKKKLAHSDTHFQVQIDIKSALVLNYKTQYHESFTDIYPRENFYLFLEKIIEKLKHSWKLKRNNDKDNLPDWLKHFGVLAMFFSVFYVILLYEASFSSNETVLIIIGLIFSGIATALLTTLSIYNYLSETKCFVSLSEFTKQHFEPIIQEELKNNPAIYIIYNEKDYIIEVRNKLEFVEDS